MSGSVADLVHRGPAQFLTARQRFERYLLWFLCLAVAGLSVVTFTVRAVANQASSASRRANTSVQAQCRFYHDIAGQPLPPTVTAFGLEISADARIAYVGLSCTNGPLPAADPRVVPLLPAGVK